MKKKKKKKKKLKKVRGFDTRFEHDYLMYKKKIKARNKYMIFGNPFNLFFFYVEKITGKTYICEEKGTKLVNFDPRPVNLFNDRKIKKISCGFGFALFLLENGILYSFGSNNHGQMCMENSRINFFKSFTVKFGKKKKKKKKKKKEKQPEKSFGEKQLEIFKINVFDKKEIVDIVDIFTGHSHSMFLGMDKKVYGCGYNEYGQLGIGSNKSKRFAVRVHIKEGVLTIACGENHTIFLTVYGNIYATGDNTYSQLGLFDSKKPNQYYSRFHSPKRINFDFGGKKVFRIACGLKHTTFLTEDNLVYVTGLNVTDSDSFLVGFPTLVDTSEQIVGVKLIQQPSKIVNIKCGDTYTVILREKKELSGVFGANKFRQFSSTPKFFKIPKAIPTYSLLLPLGSVVQIECLEGVMLFVKKKRIIIRGGGSERLRYITGENKIKMYEEFGETTKEEKERLDYIIHGPPKTFYDDNDDEEEEEGEEHTLFLSKIK